MPLPKGAEEIHCDMSTNILLLTERKSMWTSSEFPDYPMIIFAEQVTDKTCSLIV